MGLTGKIAATYAGLIAANVAAWTWAGIAFADKPALLGTAVLAYTFGLRHAFDADHIAAIDNVVRKLMQQERASYSVGFFFSLGHSTIVVVGCIAFAAAAANLRQQLDTFHNLGSVIGTVVSALFLLAIGAVNLFVLRSVWTAFGRARRGESILEEELTTLLAGRGLLARLLRPLFQLIGSAWHMYPIGLLFGLGFDTATEIGLLGISAREATEGLSFWSVLVFPALFTAGMSLMDTTDSVLMSRAYGWAFSHPIRKLWYNLTITAASAGVAFFIGGIEVLGLMGDKLSLKGYFWSSIARLNDNLTHSGYGVVAIFLASWLLCAVLYRARGYDLIAG